MMETNLIETKEVGKYRIKVYYDYYAQCPLKDDFMAFKHIWTSDKTNILSTYSNYKELFDGCYGHTISDVVKRIREEYKDEPVYIQTWDSKGCYQGDYVKGVSYITKSMFEKNVDTNTTHWRKRAAELLNGEVKEITTWIWGDVKSYVLERKEGFTKQYDNPDLTPVHVTEWYQVDSCYGYYMTADELIDHVMELHQLKKAA